MYIRKLLTILPIALVIASSSGCSNGTPSDAVLSADTLVTTAYMAPTAGEVHFAVDEHVLRLPSRIGPGRLRDIFCDSNEVQLQAARACGIRPIEGLADAYSTSERPLQRIESCREYMLDTLTMSMPYLVPRAAQLLKDIGRTFADTVRARGGGEYRLRVTSVLRTNHSVAQLQRRNRSAVTQSCHCYATTFDISWVKFDHLGAAMGATAVSLEDLKNILAEVVQGMRTQGRCYAIYERRQGCFHITVR